MVTASATGPVKYFLTIVGFIALLLIVTFVIFAAKRPGRPAVTVTFLRFTNDVDGTRLAQFNLANASPWAVERLLTYRVQVGAGELWKNYNDGWFTMTEGGLLPAESSQILTIPAATNQTRWRVGFNVRNQDGPIFSKASRLVGHAQAMGLPTTHHDLSYQIWSSPIEE